MPLPELTNEERSGAQRMMDAVNLHIVAERGTVRDKPAFVAIKLEDGRTADNNTLYDDRRAAGRAHRHNSAVFFVKIGREMMGLREALIVFQMNRMAWKRGVIFREEEVVAPQLSELMTGFIPRTLHALGDYAPNRADRRRERRSQGGVILP